MLVLRTYAKKNGNLLYAQIMLTTELYTNYAHFVCIRFARLCMNIKGQGLGGRRSTLRRAGVDLLTARGKSPVAPGEA